MRTFPTQHSHGGVCAVSGARGGGEQRAGGPDAGHAGGAARRDS